MCWDAIVIIKFRPRETKTCKRGRPINSLQVCGNAANLEDKTKEIFVSVKKYFLYSRLATFPQTYKGSIHEANAKKLIDQEHSIFHASEPAH